VESGVFTSDNEMLRRIAYVETSYGNDLDTYQSGYDGGIWAVDQQLFNTTQDTATFPALITLHQQIQTNFFIEWSSVQWSDLRRPLYSALAARLYFYTVSDAIPLSSSIQSQATYWVTHYNTLGSASDFVTRVNELVTISECSISGIDIYFILDESGSVGNSNYQQMKAFVHNTVDEFTIGADETQVGVLSYSSSATFRFYLNTYHNKASLLTAIDNLPYSGGGTNTAGAINLLRQDGFLSIYGGRHQSQAIPRVGVVITDGYSSNFSATVSAAQSAHAEGIIMTAVGIGNYLYSELDAIASDSSYVFTLSGFVSSQLAALVTSITNVACTTATEVHTDEMINTNVGEEEQVFVQIPYDTEEGLTIKMNVTNGTVRIYVSDLIATPNEAFYGWTGETNGCLDIFLDPDQLNRTVGVSVHVVIQGVDTHNEFLFISENGNTALVYDVPSAVMISTVTATTVSVAWTAITTCGTYAIIGYTVELSEEQFGHSIVRVNTSETSIIISGLEEYVTYECKVAAITSVAVGRFSPSITVTTLEAAPSAPPLSPSGSAQSATVITLEWDPPPPLDINGEIDYYVVELVEVYTAQMWTFHVMENYINISSLHAFYTYSYRIASFTIQLGPFTSYFYVTTSQAVPNGEPQNFTASSTSPFMAELSWSPPLAEEQNGVIINYIINVTDTETGDEFQLSTSHNTLTIASNLKPYTTYTCVIAAETFVGLGPFTQHVSFTTHEYIPSDPEFNVSMRANEPNELLVTWTTPDSPNGIILDYTVYCIADEGQGVGGILPPDVVVVVPGTYHSAIVTGLTPYTFYNCYVTARTSAGEGNSSVVVAAQTDESEPGDAPTNFKAVAVNSTSIQLTWDLPQLPYGNILSYNITYNTSYGNVSHVQSSTELRLIVHGLEEYTWYRFEIFASTRVGAGPETYVIARTGLSEPDAPPIEVSSEVESSTTVLISWQPPPFEDQNGPIVYYILILSDLVFSLEDIEVNTSSLNYIATHLEEHNTYSYIVAAATDVGTGPYSAPLNFTTEEDVPSAPPSEVIGHALSSTIISFTWLEVPDIHKNGIILYYEVRVVENETGILWTFFAVNKDINIASLHPYYNYVGTVTAHTTVGAGPFSAAVSVQTDQAAPSCPPLQLMAEKTSNSISLTWDAPPIESQNGIISQYVLRILEDDTSTTRFYYSNTTSTIVFGLHPYYIYKCSVAAETVDIGPYTAVITLQLDEDSPSAPPVNPSGSSFTSTSIPSLGVLLLLNIRMALFEATL
jgi:receptor-type tyrosine-protein phosphatase Q